MDNLITTVIAVALIGVTVLLGVNMGGDVILNYQARAEASQIISDAQTIAGAWREFARGNNGDPTLTGYCWGSSGATDLVAAYLGRLPTPPKGAADNTANYYYPALVKSYGTNGAATKIGPSNAPADSIALQLKSARVCSTIDTQAGYSVLNKLSALSGDLMLAGTSATSNTVATGSKSFTTQTAIPTLSAGVAVKVYSNASALNYMDGTVTSYTSGTGALVVNVLTIGGSGTKTDWQISLDRRPYDCVYVDTAGTGAPAQGDAMLFIYRVFDQNNFTAASRTACP